MYKIQNSRDLSGSVTIPGSKNAILPILAYALHVKGKITLHNVPDIMDVHDFLHFYESIGAKYSFSKNTLTLDCSSVDGTNIDTSMIARTRAGIYFISGLFRRFNSATLPYPKGDKIGKRPIDEHVDGYRNMGYNFLENENTLELNGTGSSEDITLKAYFAVSATANLIMGASMRPGTTRIELCAFEPHIFNLIDFMRTLGVDISVRYDHTIIVQGCKEIVGDFEHKVISDYLQSGTFAIIGALCSKEYIDIHNARIMDLSAFLYKLHQAGVKTQDMGNDILRVYRSDELKAVDIQTNIFPGFPTDLMPLFATFMTQCEGTSRIHEILYEGRLNWLVEFERLGGGVRIINLHEAKITGKTELIGGCVNSWDLRSGAAMVIAGLVAEGETLVENIYWISRGYDNFLTKLQSLGANITEI